MTEIRRPIVDIQIISASSGGPSGSTSIVTPLPPPIPECPTSDEYWQNWSGGALPYSWDGSQWTKTIEGSLTQFGLEVRLDGPPGNWTDGLRATTLEITVNSGTDEGNFGFLTSQTVTLFNTNGDAIGSDNWNFSAYGETLTRSITINNSADLDYSRFVFDSFLYNQGPIVTQICFII